MKSTVLISILIEFAYGSIFGPNSGTSNNTSFGAPIEIHGSKFFNSVSGEQFFIKGVAYQLSRKEGDSYDRITELAYIDSLANATSCLRDLELFQELGINAIRVFQVNPNADHGVCMYALQKAGIYVLADLAEHEQSINRDSPAWTTDLKNRYTLVIDALAPYENVLGFFAGNEVTTSVINVDASPYVRAAIRDAKAHIKKMGYRAIPVGYATNDDAQIRNSLTNYFACNLDQANNSQADFMGLNMYEWCGYSSYVTSGYRERTKEFKDYPIPVFFSEFGCNAVTPRPFTEVEVLYGVQMTGLWLGGLAYEYFDHVNKYGLVKELPGAKVSRLTDFNTLKKQFNAARPKGLHVSEYEPRIEVADYKCYLPNEVWSLPGLIAPIPDENKCKCMQSMLSCVVSPYNTIDHVLLMKTVCDQIDCSDIVSNSITGHYGVYADCGVEQRLSYALTKLFENNGQDPDVCDFDGKALLISQGEIKAAQRRVDCDALFATQFYKAMSMQSTRLSQDTSDLYRQYNVPSPLNAETNYTNGRSGSDPAKELLLLDLFSSEEDFKHEDVEGHHEDRLLDASINFLSIHSIILGGLLSAFLIIPT